MCKQVQAAVHYETICAGVLEVKTPIKLLLTEINNKTPHQEEVDLAIITTPTALQIATVVTVIQIHEVIAQITEEQDLHQTQVIVEHQQETEAQVVLLGVAQQEEDSNGKEKNIFWDTGLHLSRKFFASTKH